MLLKSWVIAVLPLVNLIVSQSVVADISSDKLLEFNDTPTVRESITLTDVLNNTLSARGHGINWLKTDLNIDSLATSESDNKIVINRYNGVNKVPTVYKSYDTNRFKDGKGNKISYDSFIFSADLQYIALEINTVKVWSKSYLASYYVFDLSNLDLPARLITKSYKNGVPSTVDSTDLKSEIQGLLWSPRGHNLAFVQDNNLYAIVDSFTNLIQVTEDGNETLSNGIPDWVYEEEMWETKEAFLWSPTATKLVYVKFDSTQVGIEILNQFTDRNDNGVYSENHLQYPKYYNQRYPKAGTNNTKVQLFSADLSTGRAKVNELKFNADKLTEEPLLTDLVFTPNTSNPKLIVRFVSRVQDQVFTSVSEDLHSIQLIRNEKAGQDILAGNSDGGWYDSKTILTLPAFYNLNGLNQESYIDTVVLGGYYHFALFSPVTAAKPKFILTKGSYDVIGIEGIDYKDGYLYYSSTEIDSTAKDIYKVRLDGNDKKHLTGNKDTKDLQLRGTFGSSVSPLGQHVVISYLGPDIPYHTLTLKGDLNSSVVLQDNLSLKTKLTKKQVPRNKFYKVQHPNLPDSQLNIQEILPANFDCTKKYHLLIYVYNGPTSQTVSRAFGINLQRWVVGSRNDTIVLTVDGRGCKNQGRKYLTSVNRNLGDYEIKDQFFAANLWKQKNYIIKDTVGIWGKSYGGYTTVKSLELQPTGKDQIFKFGLSLSPVTDWKYYDTIYTERFMSTTQLNTNKYLTSRVNNFANFKSSNLFLVHGTWDDNVHIDNSLYLLHGLATNEVLSYEFTPIIDNDHYYREYKYKKHLYTRFDRFLTKQHTKN